MHCASCGFTSEKEEQLCTLPLELPNQPQKIEVLLANQWGEQPLGPGEAPYQCPNEAPCGPGARVQRSVWPKHWPTILILNLKRFAWQAENHTPYHLRGVIEHHGPEATGGHYTAFVQASNNFWYFCDDCKSPQQ
eukprot:1587922-Karenia_brevis.AAC.1